jgi:membrane protease subunit (stomatin/prohibitin family)
MVAAGMVAAGMVAAGIAETTADKSASGRMSDALAGGVQDLRDTRSSRHRLSVTR